MRILWYDSAVIGVRNIRVKDHEGIMEAFIYKNTVLLRLVPLLLFALSSPARGQEPGAIMISLSPKLSIIFNH